MLKTKPGSVAGSVYVTRGARILAEFFGHHAQRYAESFIRAIEDEDEEQLAA